MHKVIADKMQPLLKGRELPQGITGWYYQQFLKMEYSHFCNNEYYMSWDGDTVPCKEVVMFNDEGKPKIAQEEFKDGYIEKL